MRNKVSLMAAVLLLLASVALYADRKPSDGKITSINMTEKRLVVQGEKGDQWDLYWTETTRLKGKLILEELKVGDVVHFDFIEKDGQKLLTELERTKASSSS